jgi:hypothetical protein
MHGAKVKIMNIHYGMKKTVKLYLTNMLFNEKAKI